MTLSPEVAALVELTKDRERLVNTFVANPRMLFQALTLLADEVVRLAAYSAPPRAEVGREEVARALCKRRNTAQCASICLSRFASSNRDGKCPDALIVFRDDVEAVIALFQGAQHDG